MATNVPVNDRVSYHCYLPIFLLLSSFFSFLNIYSFLCIISLMYYVFYIMVGNYVYKIRTLQIIRYCSQNSQRIYSSCIVLGYGRSLPLVSTIGVDNRIRVDISLIIFSPLLLFSSPLFSSLAFVWLSLAMIPCTIR